MTFKTMKVSATQLMDCSKAEFHNFLGIVTVFVAYFGLGFIAHFEYEGFVTKLLSSNSCLEFILDWPRVGGGPNAAVCVEVDSYCGRATPGYQEPWQPRPPLLGVASACSLTHFCARRPQVRPGEATCTHTDFPT